MFPVLSSLSLPDLDLLDIPDLLLAVQTLLLHLLVPFSSVSPQTPLRINVFYQQRRCNTGAVQTYNDVTPRYALPPPFRNQSWRPGRLLNVFGCSIDTRLTSVCDGVAQTFRPPTCHIYTLRRSSGDISSGSFRTLPVPWPFSCVVNLRITHLTRLSEWL